MRTRLSVPITPRAFSKLVRLAVRERRRIHQQAAILLERALGIEPGAAVDADPAPRDKAAEGVAQAGRSK